MGEHLNGTVGHTETDPNALGESDLWILNGNIENLSRLVEQGISSSDVERIPRGRRSLTGEYVNISCEASFNFL